MDKLEQYLEQVCRGIGGPVELRQHVRQELREHLLDAVAQHKKVGLSDEDSLRAALEEFGQPEDVRSELEATHGQRMTWIIDKALQWKEMTMKAKWLWMTWAYLGLVTVVAMEVLFITFNVIFIIPKFQKLMQDGIIDPAILEESDAKWMVNFLRDLSYVGGKLTLPLIILPTVAWGLFEWRVKSDNKPFMRLSALGTVAVGLMGILGLMAGSLVVMVCLGAPALGQLARPFALEQVANLDTSTTALEQALAKRDWQAMLDPEKQISTALNRLAIGPAVGALTIWNQPHTNELRATLKAAHERFRVVEQAILAEDAERLDAELPLFRKAFGPLQEAAKRPAL